MPNPYLIWVKLGAMIAIVGAIWFHGYRTCQNRWDAAVLAEEAQVLRETVRVHDVSYQVVKQYVPKIEKVYIENKHVKETIPYLVPLAADNACVVNNGFVWLHNGAASGVPVPRDTPGISKAAPGVTLSGVADTVADNYGRFREMKTQCQGLVDWIQAIRAKPGTMKEK